MINELYENHSILSPPGTLMGWVTKVILLAGVNYAVGRLSLLLAVPPGFATAVFPPSGIALAALLLFGYRLWPGIFIGSCLFSAHQAFDTSTTEATIQTSVIALSIAMGSTFQAIAGAYLIRRFIAALTPLDEERDVVLFLLLGGPVSCIIASTCGVTTLHIAGAIPRDGIAFNWFTWWVGDTIGVLIFAPLLMIVFGQTHPVMRRRMRSVVMPLCFTFIVVVTVFIYTREREREKDSFEIDRQATLLARTLQRNFDLYTEVLMSLVNFYESSVEVDREEFRTFTARSLSRHKGIKALEWIPRVRDEDRAEFVQRTRAEGFATFRLTERDAQGKLILAMQRPAYYPVYFVEPYIGNEAAFGFDLGSNRTRSDAIHRAIGTGQPITTGRINLVQEATEHSGVLVMTPVYNKNVRLDTLAMRQEHLTGFVLGVFQIDRIVNEAIGRSSKNMSFAIFDESAKGDDRLLFNHTPENSEPTEMALSASIEMPGRRWTLQISPTTRFLIAQRGWQASIVLAAGLAFTALLGGFLLVLTGRTAQIESLVSQRTAELSAAVDELGDEVLIRQKIQDDLENRNTDLIRANKELDEFTYVASHDLQEPLRNMISFCTLLAEDAGEKLSDDVAEDLKHIQSSSKRMQNLVKDLLILSRARRKELRRERVELDRCLDNAIDALKLRIAETHTRIDRQPLPVITGDPTLMTQLFQNLVSNAIKFADETPIITITAEKNGEHWTIGVSDNGIGIDREYAEHVFAPFKRLHGITEYEGTGIGLTICQKAVERHGGRIWVEFDGAKGTHFRFTLPAENEQE